MELRILRYFLAVASEENISRAARQLHITQPTLSRQLHDLETELGVQLFERGTRHITLTPQGLLFRRRAREIIELSDKARQELICGCDDIKGTVAIGAGELQSVLRLGTYMRNFVTCIRRFPLSSSPPQPIRFVRSWTRDSWISAS